MQPERLHVLVLTRAIAPLHGVGGLERHGRDLIEHLLARGACVTLVTQPPYQRSGDASWTHPRLATRFVPYVTFPGAGMRGTTILDRSTAYPLFGWRAGRVAARRVAEGGITVVHAMGAAALGYAIARASDRYETVPLLLNPHGMEEFGSSGPGLPAGKRLMYGPLRRAVRTCARAADRVVATDTVLSPMVQSHLAVPESRIVVVPNAVDLDAIDSAGRQRGPAELRERLGVPPDGVLMASVGRLERNKGFHVLVDALRRVTNEQTDGTGPGLRPWRLVLIGDGSERASLERAIADARLGGLITLAGRVGDLELHDWYEAADLFVHPSLYEGSSIVTLEAMAHHCPVVATTAGGLRDKVKPGVNGWLAPPGDSAVLAACVREALTDPQRLRSMGAASRSIVERTFAWPAVMDRLLTVYGEMLKGSAAFR